jgi:hypothetical protein
MTTFKLSSIVGRKTDTYISTNIGHFFHENLFYAISAFIDNNDITWTLCIHLQEWEMKLTQLCAEYLNIQCEYSDLSGYRSGLDYGIKKTHNFDRVLEIIQNSIKMKFPEIEFQESYKVLYFRNDAHARKMIGYENTIDEYFDEIIYDMSSLSFEDQVKLFMKTSHFITIEGACLTNVIFMNKRAKVLSITPHMNSWQLMFGTSICVDTFETFSLGLSNFDDNIIYNSEIENRIKQFISV